MLHLIFEQKDIIILDALDKILNNKIKLGLDGAHQYENASLGVALAASYLKYHPLPHQDKTLFTKDFFTDPTSIFQVLQTPNSLQKPFLDGLEACFWPGRSQKIQLEQFPNVTFYLDGAHTIESLQVCKKWFLSQKDESAAQVLVWNCSDNRSPLTLLEQLTTEPIFSHVIFSTNISSSTSTPIFMRVPTNPKLQLLEWQSTNEQIFQSLSGKFPTNQTPRTLLSPSIEKSLETIQEISKQQKVQVLITGSLYLVGGMLEALQPAMRDY